MVGAGMFGIRARPFATRRRIITSCTLWGFGAFNTAAVAPQLSSAAGDGSNLYD